jgi:MFS family permease
MPVVGRFADHVGRKRTFLGGLVLFRIGSALSAFAPSLLLLSRGSRRGWAARWCSRSRSETPRASSATRRP